MSQKDESRPRISDEELAFRIEAHQTMGTAVFPDNRAYRPAKVRRLTLEQRRARNEKELNHAHRDFVRARSDEHSWIPRKARIGLAALALWGAALGAEKITNQNSWEIEVPTFMVYGAGMTLVLDWRKDKKSAPERQASALRDASWSVNPLGGHTEAVPLVPSWLAENLPQEKARALAQDIFNHGNDAQLKRIFELGLNKLIEPTEES